MPGTNRPKSLAPFDPSYPEAINRIIKKDSNFESKITNAKSIIGLRNQVIHVYDSISDENIWSILINHLPKLKKEIEILISQHDKR